MANVLDKIVADKREEIKRKQIDLPLSQFKDSLTQSDNSFFDALAKDSTSYIFECKKASPSKGLIRENFDLDEITQAYAKEAACFSVLTDEKYFQGKFEYLPYVKSKVSQPLLNKDFFVDSYQVYLARHLGANAILLMLSVLDDAEYLSLSQLAREYNMDVLTEVSNEQETRRALSLGANIIGINNRNLRDLSTDLSRTEQLVPLIRQDKKFKGIIISESGIYTNQDIQRLSPLVDGFLVGSALMAQDDLNLAVSSLVYGRVKVCGITSVEQAKLVSQFPVSYMGFIFTPNSKRFISAEIATEIVRCLPFQYVGVFVDQALEHVVELSHKLGLKAVQLHGHEDSEYQKALRKLIPADCEIWKAFGIEVDASNSVKQELTLLQENVTAGILSKILLDCKVGAQSGGTGQSFDWQIVKSLDDKQNIILAGGISVDNIIQARQCGLGVIDLNSGVETAPGIKSAELLRNLFGRLRA